MGLTIEDGKGSGGQAEVKGNKLLVSGIFASLEHYANHSEGQAYNLVFSATPTGAGDCFLYFKNEDPNYYASVEGIYLKMAADDSIEIKLLDEGTPVGGNELTPVNLNTAVGNKAIGVFQDGADITGLSGGKTALKLHHASSAGGSYFNFNQDIILGPNGTLTLYAGTGTVLIEGHIPFSFHGAE